MDKSLALAAEVIALRLPLIAGEAALLPGALLKPGHPESSRMVTEKVAALGEGMVEATLKVAQINMALGMAALSGNPFGWLRLSKSAPKRIARAFAAPGKKRLAANARRLRKS